MPSSSQREGLAITSVSFRPASRKKEIERLRPDEIKRSNIARPYIRFEFERPSGKDVLEVNKLAGGYGATNIFSGLHLTIARGEKVAIIGKNGAGKTTLVQTLIGEYEIAWGLLTAGGVVGALPVTLLDSTSSPLMPSAALISSTAVTGTCAVMWQG